MSTYQGHDGSISIASGVMIGKVNFFTCSDNRPTVDTSGFGDDGTRTRESTVRDVTGSLSGTLDNGHAMDPEQAVNEDGTFNPTSSFVTLTLRVADGVEIGPFKARFPRKSVSVQYDGSATFAAEFESDGPVPLTQM